jgi:hypothetical protein
MPKNTNYMNWREISILWRLILIRNPNLTTTFVLSIVTIKKYQMKKIEIQITINSPINQVWKALMQFDNYPLWNPFIQSISGNPEVGQQLAVSIHPPQKSPMKFTPIVLKHEINQEFRWLGKLGISGIFDGEHYFKLQALNNEQTVLTHGEIFTGLLSGLIFKMAKDSTLKGFDLMNQALKTHLENQ